MHAEALAWFAEETGEQDKAHSPLRRGEVVDTRPFVRGHLSTGVTLDQAARAAKSKMIRAVKYGGCDAFRALMLTACIACIGRGSVYRDTRYSEW